MKVSKYLTNKQFCGNYPISYNLYFQSITKKQRPGQILKKKRYELEYSKISSKLSVFWDIIEDFKLISIKTDEGITHQYVSNAQCCFICGFYIIPSQRQEPNVRRPFKHGDLCHVECYNKNIKMEDVTQKLNPKSTLICDIQKPTKQYDIVCRNRVFNDPLSILKHFQSHSIKELQIPTKDPDVIKLFLTHFREDWKSFRDKNFLKPTGEPFKK